MPPRKRRKFGALRALPSGRYQAHFTHPDGERIKAPSTFETRGDAEGWLKTQERELELGIWEHPELKANQAERNALTVGQWVERWLDLKETEIEPTTVANYRKALNPRLLKDGTTGAIKDLPLVDLTKAHVFAWWDEVTERFNTPPQNYLAYKHLRAACAAAVERELITVNPVEVKAATKRPKPKNKELATREELQGIVDHIFPRYKLAAVLCLFHGLRIGEALALKDTDFMPSEDGGEVAVRVRTTMRDGAKGNHIIKVPKTAAGYRDVPMMAEFIPVYREHVNRFPVNHNGLMTTSSRSGNAVYSEVFRSAMSTAKKKAGVRPEITPHYGRNWLITELAGSGASAKEIGELLGQEDVSTIVNTYMKVKPGRPAELMRNVGKPPVS